MSTTTSTLFSATPKAVHVGEVNIRGSAMITASSSVGDRVFLAKVPHGAIIDDAYFLGTNGATATTYDVGFLTGVAEGGGGSLSCLAAGVSTGSIQRYAVVGLPPQISVSDADPNRYAVLVAKIAGGTMTTSTIISFNLQYRMDSTVT